MKKSRLFHSILLFMAALIWGTAFVAQSSGMDHVGGFTFTTGRSFTGALFLIPVACLFAKKDRPSVSRAHMVGPVTKAELIGGIICGTFLSAASNFQQIGLAYTTVAKSGFLTALYVILVPLIGIFLKRKTPKSIWLSVGLFFVGMYFLCLYGKGSYSFSFGDILELAGAFFFALQILSVDFYAPRCRGVVLSCIQFFVCGIESTVLMLLFEHPTGAGILGALPQILYVGIFSSGIAYTLQILGQSGLSPALSSLIMCLESVISAISGWVILGEAMSPVEVLGAGMIFTAIVLASRSP